MSQDRVADFDVQPYVLIVDDELGVLDVTRSMALAKGWRPLLANTAEHALRLFREHASTIDTALLDLHMPGMDGAELARSMRELCPNARLVFMTGDESGAAALQHEGHLANGVLLKPFSVDELERLLFSPARAA
ncbi:MAG TPA: response regulator [Candidatus Acidoferrales bacterium]|nr:response regulator [Candidatus Acidoferrales bacterium]